MITDPSTVEQLYFVWNADWSLRGAARAAADFVRGVEACALCDIAYNGARKKPAWKECHASIPVPIETLYRNKLPSELAAVAGDDFPVVIARVDGTAVKLLGQAQIETCEGDVDRFKQLLTDTMATTGLTF